MSRIWNRFREQIKKDREKPGLLLADGVITLLCVVRIVCVAGLVQDFLAERSVSMEEPSFYYALQDGNYQYLLRMTRRNRAMGADGNNYQPYYAVADYYEAAGYCRMYEEAGDEERLELWSAKMADAESRLGDFFGQAEKIKELLNNL